MSLQARAIRVVRGSATLLDGVDFDASKGELVALVGPNGAGKSTLLSVLAGDIEPDDGAVTWGERALADIKPRDLAQIRAVVPQATTVSFPFTALDIVEMGRAPWAASDEDDAVIAAAMREADVTHLAARTFTSLSGGEQARVTLARSLAQTTEVLLLDEPTAALDLQHQEMVLSAVRRRADEGATVVVVLHDLGLASAYADRVVLLESGSCVAEGTPDDVFTAERISAVYRRPVDVVRHDGSNGLVVVPLRPPR